MCLQVPLCPPIEPQITHLHPDNYIVFSKLSGSGKPFNQKPNLQCSFRHPNLSPEGEEGGVYSVITRTWRDEGMFWWGRC